MAVEGKDNGRYYKKKHVKRIYETALKHYYRQACEVADGVKAAEAYRQVMNTTVREIK